MKFELSQEDVVMIRQMADISLKAGGLQNLNGVNKILNILQRPLPEKISKTPEESEKK